LELVDSFLAIAEDGSVTTFCGHVDLGTGVQTALGQIVAEELDVAFEQVTVILGDTDKTPDQGGTWASETIQFAAQPLRQAAAEARAFLLGLAEVRLATPKSRLAVTNGVVHDQLDPTHRVSYGELIGGKQFKIGVMGIAEPKSPDAYTIVGRPVRRIDTAAKVTGSFEELGHGTQLRRPAGLSQARQGLTERRRPAWHRGWLAR
jgi:nicotinate dehydrogenase subunit B